ncbi:MAG TPA: DMT family transporter [Acidimicrobiales bacterium]|nr:DMT family transporter [Acidimicrobiales bacterium]
MAVLFALLGALCFALGPVLQQKGTFETAAAEGDPRFLVQLIRRPVWLMGAACQGLGWVFQAIALNIGSLIVVQAITTLSLVLALPLGHRITDQQITRTVWFGALAVVGGILAFLIAGSPAQGVDHPSASAWWTACVVILAVVAVGYSLARGRRGAIAAVLFGASAGVCFGLQAAVTKEFTTVVNSGLAAILSSWTTWVLIVTALVGFVLQQSALKSGVLAPAIASSNALTLVTSVILGFTVFEETVDESARRGLAFVGLGVALAGVAVLASAPSGEPELRPGSRPRRSH